MSQFPMVRSVAPLGEEMNEDSIAHWLREEDPHRLDKLFAYADELRRRYVGDEVWIRGLIEISSYCRRRCMYCGLRAPRHVARYRLDESQIMTSASVARSHGLGTVVLQGGEDVSLTKEFIGHIVSRIRRELGLVTTLSLGEREVDEFCFWRDMGATRYLLRFETSDASLYSVIHPSLCSSALSAPLERVERLRALRRLGYEIGSGVMVGIPGQSVDSLASDLSLFRELDLDMVGLGPFLPHPASPLGRVRLDADGVWRLSPEDESNGLEIKGVGSLQTPSSVLMTQKVIALTRVLLPDANIPSSTAIATLDPASGGRRGLECGGNVLMPNLTPTPYRTMYDIYPGKGGHTESLSSSIEDAFEAIQAINRIPGLGTGNSQRFVTRGKNIERLM